MRTVFRLFRKLVPDRLIRQFTDWLGALVRLEVGSAWNNEVLVPFDQRITRIENQLSKLQKSSGVSQDSAAGDVLDARFLAMAKMYEELERAIDGGPFKLFSDDEYKELEARYHSLSSSISEAHFDLLLASLPSEGRVVEIGCGNGRLLKLIGTRRAELDLFGIDLTSYSEWSDDAGQGVNLEQVESGESTRVERSNAVFTKGDGIDYLKDCTVDSLGCVLALHVIEHLDNKQLRQMLDTSFAKLCPGGRIVLETPNTQSTFTMTRYYYIDPTHVSPRHPSLLVFLLESIGFIDVEIIFLENEEPVLVNTDDELRRFLLSGSPNILIRGSKPQDSAH